MKQSIRLYSLIGFSLLIVACGHAEQEQQAEAERISKEYQKQVEVEEQAKVESATFRLPPRPEDTPEPVGPPPNVMEMTNPELVVKELNSKDKQQRLAAVKRLGFLSAQNKITDGALQALINVFNADAESNIVDAAAIALGQTCHPTALQILMNNLQRHTVEINLAAVSVLGDVAGFRAAEALDVLIENLEGSTAAKAAQLRTAAESAKAKILARNGSAICTG